MRERKILCVGVHDIILKQCQKLAKRYGLIIVESDHDAIDAVLAWGKKARVKVEKYNLPFFYVGASSTSSGTIFFQENTPLTTILLTIHDFFDKNEAQALLDQSLEEKLLAKLRAQKMPTKEIARQLDMPISTLKYRLHVLGKNNLYLPYEERTKNNPP